MRDAVSHEKPKKRVFASHGIAKGYVINAMFLSYNTIDILIKDALFKWPQKVLMVKVKLGIDKVTNGEGSRYHIR